MWVASGGVVTLDRLRRAVRAGVEVARRPVLGLGGPPGELPPLAGALGLRDDALLVVPADGQVVFRLLGRSRPRLRDFQSARDRERPIGPQQDFLDYLGVSVFGREEVALANATQFPKLVARVHLPAGAGFTIARTLADVEEHYSVWGEPDALVNRVVDVHRVDAPS